MTYKGIPTTRHDHIVQANPVTVDGGPRCRDEAAYRDTPAQRGATTGPADTLFQAQATIRIQPKVETIMVRFIDVVSEIEGF